jgi:hypothetical protein
VKKKNRNPHVISSLSLKISKGCVYRLNVSFLIFAFKGLPLLALAYHRALSQTRPYFTHTLWQDVLRYKATCW